MKNLRVEGTDRMDGGTVSDAQAAFPGGRRRAGLLRILGISAKRTFAGALVREALALCRESPGGCEAKSLDPRMEVFYRIVQQRSTICLLSPGWEGGSHP